MNVALPDEFTSRVDDQADGGGSGSTRMYARQQFRRLLLDGANSGAGAVANDAYFATLRDRVRSGS